MAILGKAAILAAVRRGDIVITPFDEAQLNPNSYNLRLGRLLAVYDKMLPTHERADELYEDYRKKRAAGYWDGMAPAGRYPPAAHYVDEPLDMAVEEPATELAIPDGGLVLWPGVLYLGTTQEYTETHNLVPCIEGRSSVGRLGLCVHVTAGFGDCFFKGTWTLELTVVHPLRIYSGVAVAQIIYTTLEGEATPYAGKYQGQSRPRPSGLWREFPGATGQPRQ